MASVLRLALPGLLVVALSACADELTIRQVRVVHHRPAAAQPVVEPSHDADASSADAAQALDAVAEDAAADLDAEGADARGPGDTQPDDDVPDAGPEPEASLGLSLPSRLALPWVPADGRPSVGAVPFALTRPIPEPSALVAEVSGDARLGVDALELGSGAVDGTLRLRFAGATALARAEGEVVLRIGTEVIGRAAVHAYAGARTSTLPPAAWAPVDRVGERLGVATTVRLATAPFPHASGPWTDDRVHIFIPDGHTPREATDFVVHFHGHGATIAETLATHRYREQVWASGGNQILILPQGPVEASSGNFGRLMAAPGLSHLLDDVVAILYRDGHILSPEVGDLTLTEHSGGYLATAANLGVVTTRGQVVAAILLDGLYGRASEFAAFARDGGFLRSNHTASGGTRNNNLALLATLGGLATDVMTARTLATGRAVLWPTTASHHDATWWEQGMSEALRWSTPRSRRGPRVELRTVALQPDGQVAVTWASPDDDLLEAFVLETSEDGAEFTARTVGPDARSVLLPSPTAGGGLHVRIRTRLADVPESRALPSDTYRVGRRTDGRRLLVVDGFDRVLDGSWAALSHGGAARVAAALGGADAATNEAVVEGDLALDGYSAVVWLLGDESTADHAFSAAEQARLTAYLNGGGRVLASGSEVAWELGARGVGPSFLAALGATYVGDDAEAGTARGVGPLEGLGEMRFDGPGALYPEEFPDILGNASGATRLLEYPGGKGAAVGRAGRAALVAFPLELVAGDDRLGALLTALLDFLGAVP